MHNALMRYNHNYNYKQNNYYYNHNNIFMIYFDTKNIAIDEIYCPEYSFYMSIEDNKKIMRDAHKHFKINNMKNINATPRMLFSKETNKNTYPILGKEFKLTITTLIYYENLNVLFAIVKLKKNWTCLPFPYILLMNAKDNDRVINNLFINEIVQKTEPKSYIEYSYNTEFKINVKLGMTIQKRFIKDINMNESIINPGTIMTDHNISRQSNIKFNIIKHTNYDDSPCINENILSINENSPGANPGASPNPDVSPNPNPNPHINENILSINESQDEEIIISPIIAANPINNVNPIIISKEIKTHGETNAKEISLEDDDDYSTKSMYSSKTRFIVNKQDTIKSVHKTHDDYDKEIAIKFSRPKIKSKLHCVNDEILILPDNQKVIKGPRGGCYIYTGGKKKYIANKK